MPKSDTQSIQPSRQSELKSEFKASELAKLKPYFSNLDRPVFVLKNLPEVIKGALFSRYSRTDKSLRRVLLDEFINNQEAGLAGLVSAEQSNDHSLAIQKAEEFYSRVLVGYGDDSVEELGGAHLAIEGVSRPVVKLIQDSRIGISPLEKSSRYVYFDQKIDGHYLYYRDPELLASPHAKIYTDAMDQLFETYAALIKPVKQYYQTEFPQQSDETDRAYQSTIRAKVCDTLRGLLPLGVLSNTGLYGNGRSFRYLITKLLASPWPEARQLAETMHQELSTVIPSFVKRANDPKYGQPTIQYLETLRQTLTTKTAELASPLISETFDDTQVKLTHYDPNDLDRSLAHLIFSQSDLSLTQATHLVNQLEAKAVAELIESTTEPRQNRFHKPGRWLENNQLTYELVTDYATFYDLHRHRTMTQERQPLTPYFGLTVPSEIDALGLGDRYRLAMTQAVAAYETIYPDFPIQAQYLLPQAHRLRWYITLNLREMIHIAELRTTPQGHPGYRLVVQQMYQELIKRDARLQPLFKFINLETAIGLERRESEKRLDQKLSQLKPTG
ncbi:MAG: thymidylate synthase complementing protein ThyX [Candidatus Berkelbacteria bacterium Gr01-1014_85]|uniref:Thymidylate synthase complementing protein ThyX n=1 Tax=Candidatus Berkelbacteria bacterium Gr01-1014_85 TaxID=2017150 RepID=A0A554JD13_9BACT|nr:MAG: thymidylate synthase complementing protein ThyX [Candidatus Berkelbacteria bacterium Gr01-1014_85]